MAPGASRETKVVKANAKVALLASVGVLAFGLVWGALWLRTTETNRSIHLLAIQADSLFGEFREKFGRYPSNDSELVTKGGARERKWYERAEEYQMRARLVHRDGVPYVHVTWGDSTSNYVEYRLSSSDG